ncbi:MAG TPA: DMT family transporter [Opitutaceae bacterium]|nr:DMT family transporter [Opitutaceae bacterium]
MSARMQDGKQQHSRAVLGLLGAALLWSMGGVLLKSVHIHPLAVAGGRGLIAALFLMACLRRWRLRFSPVMVGAALAYTGTTALFAAANQLTTAANAILLQYTAPIYVAWLGRWLLGERVTRLDWVTIVVVFAGMALFFADQLSADGLLGSILAVVSGVSFALMTVLLRKQKDAEPVDSIVLGNLVGAAIGLPFFAAGPLPSPAGWAALIALGTLQLGLSYLLYSRAIRHVTALGSILILMLEPLLNPVWAALVLGERPGRWALVGGAVVLGAVTTRALLLARRQFSEPSAA